MNILNMNLRENKINHDNFQCVMVIYLIISFSVDKMFEFGLVATFFLKVLIIFFAIFIYKKFFFVKEKQKENKINVYHIFILIVSSFIIFIYLIDDKIISLASFFAVSVYGSWKKSSLVTSCIGYFLISVTSGL